MDINYINKYGELEKTHWWFTIRKKIILQLLQKFIHPNKRGELKILNVGAASGESSNWLSTLGNIVSVENDPLFIEYLQSKNIPVTNASITALPFESNSFNLVCAFDVIEHVEEDNVAIKELLRVCKPGGKVCITVPAFQSLWGNHDVVNEHYRRYVKHQLQNLLNNNIPNTILYTSYFNTILFPFIFLFRKIIRLFKNNKKNDDSDFAYFSTNKFLNSILKIIFGTEPFLLKFVRFPFGVSLIMIIEKEAALNTPQ